MHILFFIGLSPADQPNALGNGAFCFSHVHEYTPYMQLMYGLRPMLTLSVDDVG